MPDSSGFTLSTDRSLFVASYSESHGLLLLRARPKVGAPRLDILFQDARAAEFRTWMDGVTIQEVALEALADWESKPLALAEPSHRAFLLIGSDWRGYVLAGTVNVLEDDGDPKARSPLLGPE